MRILVVLTGGTIGSVVMNNKIDIEEEQGACLIRLYESRYGRDAAFELGSPYRILSENLTLSYWTELKDYISRIDTAAYDGVIITHGSDTLSYTSAMMGLLFGHLPIPVVITASNYVLDDPRSNGLDNFSSAVALIRAGKLKGVFTVFQNNRGDNTVYLPTRIMESDPYSDQYLSFGGSSYGKITGNDFIYEAAAVNPEPGLLAGRHIGVPVIPEAFDKEVLLIKSYPGLNYERINLDNPPGAVLNYLYHSATACVEGGSTSFLDFIKRCRERSIPVYVASFKNVKRVYETSSQMLEMGVIPLGNISIEAAYAKLLIAYNQTQIDTERYMERNIYYECLP